jgi:hypothetical protein
MFLKMQEFQLIAKIVLIRTLIIKLKINIKHNLSLNQVKIINTHILCKILVKGNWTKMEVIMITYSTQNFKEWILGRFKMVKISIIKHKV